MTADVNQENDTPLWSASFAGSTDAVATLLQAKARVDGGYSDQSTRWPQQ